MPDEYVIPLSIDVAGIVTNASQVKTSLTDVGTAAKNAGTAAKTSFDTAGKASDDLGNKIVSTSSKLTAQQTQVQKLTATLEAYQAVASKVTPGKNLDDFTARIAEIQSQLATLNTKVAPSIKGVGDALDGVSTKTSKFQQAIARVTDASNIGATVVSRLNRQIIGLGVSFLSGFIGAQAIESLINYISQLDLFKTKLTEVTISSDAFQQGLASTDYSKAIQSVTELGLNIQLAKEGFIDKDHVIDEYNESLGKVTGNVDSLDDAEQGLAKHAQDFIRITLLKAAANVILNDSAKDVADTAIKNQKLQDQINNFSDPTINAQNRKTAGDAFVNEGIQQARENVIQIAKNNDELQKNLDKRIAILTNFNNQQEQVLESSGSKNGINAPGVGDQSAVSANKKLQTDNANLLLQLQKQQDQLIIDDQTKTFSTRIAALTDFYNKTIAITKNNTDQALAVRGLSASQITNINEKQQLDDYNALVDFNKKKDALQKQETEQDNNLVNLKKSLNDKLISLQNDYNSAVIDGIQDQTARELKANEIATQNKVKSLQQQILDLQSQQAIYDQKVKDGLAKPGADQSFLDDIAQLNSNIAQVQTQGQLQQDRIQAEGILRRLKAQQESSQAIAKLLKQDGDLQIQAIQNHYAEVIAQAQKAGTLTTDIQKQLAIAEQQDIVQAQLDIQLKGVQTNTDLVTAKILTEQQKQGETVKQFEARQQKDLLAAQVQGIQDQLSVLDKLNAGSEDDSNNPDSVNPLGGLTDAQIKEQAKLLQQLADLKKKQDALKTVGPDNIFDLFGLSTQNAKDTQVAYQDTFNSLSSIFGSLSQLADANVAAINKQIDAINTLIQADTDAVATQQDLYNKGRANSLDAAKQKLADDQAQKAQLQKQAEAAQQKTKVLQEAQIAAEGAVQAAELATAIAKIFAAYAGLPVVGQILSIAAIATMLGAFAFAKVEAFSAVNATSTVTAEEGGIAGGDRHSNGGNKYVSMDGKDRNILEIERGERIFSRKNSEKHKRLFEAIQNNDFSKLDIGDVSIQDLLRGTGVMQQLEVARMTGSQNITLQDRANNVVVIANNSDKYLSSIDKKMDNLNKKDPVTLDMGDYWWIDYGNGKTERRYK